MDTSQRDKSFGRITFIIFGTPFFTMLFAIGIIALRMTITHDLWSTLSTASIVFLVIILGGGFVGLAVIGGMIVRGTWRPDQKPPR